MNEHTLIGSLMILIPALFHGFSRAYLKGKTVDPNIPNPKPSWKTTEFWFKVATALVGALEVFNGQATP